MYPPTLQWHERLYHRDQLKAGRYAALADAEGFHVMCFALEALGLRLLGKKADLGKYEPKLLELSQESVVLSELSTDHPGRFSKFSSLFDFVRNARNDAMHTGVYARHATAAAIELCIGLEEALMKQQQQPRQRVEDFMVKAPVTVELWQPVAATAADPVEKEAKSVARWRPHTPIAQCRRAILGKLGTSLARRRGGLG